MSGNTKLQDYRVYMEETLKQGKKPLCFEAYLEYMKHAENLIEAFPKYYPKGPFNK